MWTLWGHCKVRLGERYWLQGPGVMNSDTSPAQLAVSTKWGVLLWVSYNQKISSGVYDRPMVVGSSRQRGLD